MIKFFRKIPTPKGGKATFLEHYAYEKEEAEERGFSFKPWRETSLSAGEWGLSDDNLVTQVLWAKQRTLSFREVNFSAGRVNTNSKQPFLARARIANRGFTLSGRNWREDWVRRRQNKVIIKWAAIQISVKGVPDYAKLGLLFFSHHKDPLRGAKYHLTQEPAQMAIKQELQKIYSENGITPQYVIDNMKEALQLAKSKKDPKTMLQATAQFIDLLDMKVKEEKNSFLPALDAGDAMKAFQGAVGVLALEQSPEEDSLPPLPLELAEVIQEEGRVLSSR